MHFAQERQATILARLDRDGRVVSATLAEELEVSIDSIRRDLHELEAVGALQRVHGGAVRPLAGKARSSSNASRRTSRRARPSLARAPRS